MMFHHLPRRTIARGGPPHHTSRLALSKKQREVAQQPAAEVDEMVMKNEKLAKSGKLILKTVSRPQHLTYFWNIAKKTWIAKGIRQETKIMELLNF
jgi:hypothetical protein